MKYIVVTGNPINGLTFHGPFNVQFEAIEWADENVATEYDYWIAPLTETQ